MAMSVATALQSVRYQVYETTASFWSDDEIRSYLWQAECDLASEVQCVEIKTTLTAATSTQEYSFASSIETVRRVTYDGERLKLVDLRTLDAIDDDATSGGVQTGDPTHYYLFGDNTLGLWPVPAASGSIVEVRGNGMPTEIASSTTQFTVPGLFHRDLIDYALYRCYLKDQDDGRANTHLQLWERSKEKARTKWRLRNTRGGYSIVKDEDIMHNTLAGPA